MLSANELVILIALIFNLCFGVIFCKYKTVKFSN